MTIPEERCRAINQTRDFLIAVTNNADVPKYIKNRALQLLKHYPSEDCMEEAKEQAPDLFGDWRTYVQ